MCRASKLAERQGGGAVAHVVLVGVLPETLVNFRGDLIRRLIGGGHRVTALTESASSEQILQITDLGAFSRTYSIRRHGTNPFEELVTLRELRAEFKVLKPDVILAYTIKPVIWSGLALMGQKNTRFFALITGLGFVFQGKGVLGRALEQLAVWLYGWALRSAAGVIFHNVDNRTTFVSRGVVSQSQTFVVDGSGVNLNFFKFTKFPPPPPVFLLAARLLRAKGLYEYVAAARAVKQRYPTARFHLLGMEDPSPDRIPLREVQKWHNEGILEYFAGVHDIRPFVANAHICVLPSYHEGIPRSILEAMAMGRPILTTDVAGCRETVVPSENGYLVPKADSLALAERMIWFLENSDQWERMGRASRRMVEERFDVYQINEQMLRIMGL